MTNRLVAKAWSNNITLATKNLRSDGLNLFSYNLKIGYTKDGKKIAIDHTASAGSFYSRTTSNHVSLAKGVSDIVEKP